MDYNPYGAALAELERQSKATQGQAKVLEADLAWHQEFDSEKARHDLNHKKVEGVAAGSQLRKTTEELVAMAEPLAAMQKAAAIGWDPRYWFSDQRGQRKRELAALTAKRDEAAAKQRELHAQFEKVIKQVEAMTAELNRYASFDAAAARQSLEQAKSLLARLAADIAQVGPLKRRVDEQLEQPLADLAELEARKSNLTRDIDRAERFDRRLSNADNSYERRNVHQECEAAFDEGSPKRVIGQLQNQLRGVTRDIGKIQDRLKAIANRAARVISTLVIDGNNMCYEHGKLVGLGPLKAAASKLAEEYGVVVVFDESIVPLLRTSKAALAREFGATAKVHVVQSKADETVLAYADDPATYVISNDRFGDYREKAVVRGNRVLRHEILAGKVFIHDLGVAENYTVH